MRVALVHDWLTGMRGGEKCLEVFCELFPSADLYTLVYAPEKVSATIRHMTVKTSFISQLPWAKRAYRYYLPLFPAAIERFDLGPYDLVLSSSHCVAKGILPHRALHIAYVHAPMRYVWDQHDSYFGADSGWMSRTGMALCRSYLQQWDVRSASGVDYFIANSKNVAAKIKNLYGRDAAVIYPPVDVERFDLHPDVQTYYLIVSALVPYKKVDIAIEAFNRLRLPLKIVGDGPLRTRLRKIAEPNIEFLGWVNDQDLAGLYARSQALIFPGEEDFGIVPLEAQASGRPVIAYGRGGALETVVSLEAENASSATGMFFSEPNAESLVAAVELFQRIREGFESTNIRRHACKFSRERFKRQISDYITAHIREHKSEAKAC
ncbi:MAG: glycosyltransferase [Deltaproteobacteria bacterium]